MMRIALVLLVVVGAGTIDVAATVRQFADPAEEQRYTALTERLRCPKCQNQSIAHSDAPIAADMRERVFDLIRDGSTDAQVVNHLVARYGDFVNYRPVLDRRTLVLWLGPGFGFIVTFALVGLWVRRGAPRRAAPLSTAERRALDDLFDANAQGPRQ